MDDMYNFRANIAVLMNITPPPDRYDHTCKTNNAKFRIAQIKRKTMPSSFWKMILSLKQELRTWIKAQLYPFSAIKEEGAVAYVERMKWLYTTYRFYMEQEKLALTGTHNQQSLPQESPNLAGITK
jgi:UDP-N-acetylmuramoylalanine--D-glutamate ligase